MAVGAERPTAFRWGAGARPTPSLWRVHALVLNDELSCASTPNANIFKITTTHMILDKKRSLKSKNVVFSRNLLFLKPKHVLHTKNSFKIVLFFFAVGAFFH